VCVCMCVRACACECVCRWVGDRDWPLRNFNLSEVHCDGGSVATFSSSPATFSSSPASAASCAGVHSLCDGWAVEDFAGGGFLRSKSIEGGSFMQRHGNQELGLDWTVQRKKGLERWRELRAREDLEARKEGGAGKEGEGGGKGGYAHCQYV
jgi:hypothetical protein